MSKSKRPVRGQKIGRAERVRKYEEFSGAKAVDRSQGNVSIEALPGIEQRRDDEVKAQLKSIRHAMEFGVDNILCNVSDRSVYEKIYAELTSAEKLHVYFTNFG